MKKVAILGAGSWGTALAITLADKGQPVTLWCRDHSQAKEMNQVRENKKYLPEIRLDDLISIVTDFESSVREADVVVLAVPSKAVRETAKKLQGLLGSETIIVNTAKGIEPETLLRISEIVEEELPGTSERFVALSGPSHAEEVGLKLPTAIVSASINQQSAEIVQDLFMSSSFRVYTNDDLIGVEIGAALKNVIALATGVAEGLGFGDNAQAGLITRGMTEISRLGVKLGGEGITFAGLTGIGDLVVTCTSRHSRNRRAGIALGQGKSLETVLDEMGMVVEGVRTTKAAKALAEREGVSMPIAEQAYDMLFGGVSAKEAVGNLMGRSKKREIDDHLKF